MNFNSAEFLLVFLPLVFAAFHLSPGLWRFPILLVASSVFYGVSGLVPLGFMFVSILWGFGAALLARRDQPLWKTLAMVSVPLIILFLFKYLDFTLVNFGASDQVRDGFLFFLSVTLPAGISFYTFQIVSYIIDAKDEVLDRPQSLLKFSVFISFFPQLIAGPILRYSDISAQLDDLRRKRWLRIDARSGLKYLSIGLFGKVCVSDLMQVLIKNSLAVDFAAEATRSDVLFLLNAYAIRIFFDFWAYSLMAMGLAKLFAIDLPVNFNEPYQARTPRDFWRRWHVTLSFWLRDYVYIRLGGNAHYVRNIAIVFLACGFWHGAGWSFVLWGVYHAVLVLGYHFVRPVWDRMPAALQVAATYCLVILAWPLFFMDVGDYAVFLNVLVSPAGGDGIYSAKHWAFIAPILAWMFLTRERYWLYNEQRRALFDSPLVHAALATVSVLFISYSSTFIYFRF
ncbi:MAG: MBOAT family protein [Alphaproteobacteria bacterium]